MTASMGHEESRSSLRVGILLRLIELWRGRIGGNVRWRIHRRARRLVFLRRIRLEARGYRGIRCVWRIHWRGPWSDLRRRRADEAGERAKSQSQQRQWQFLNQQPDDLRDQPAVRARRQYPADRAVGA